MGRGAGPDGDREQLLGSLAPVLVSAVAGVWGGGKMEAEVLEGEGGRGGEKNEKGRGRCMLVSAWVVFCYLALGSGSEGYVSRRRALARCVLVSAWVVFCFLALVSGSEGYVTRSSGFRPLARGAGPWLVLGFAGRDTGRNDISSAYYILYRSFPQSKTQVFVFFILLVFFLRGLL